MSDNAGFLRDYLPQAQASIKANGGRFLVAGQKITSLEGIPPKRVIVTAWDSIEARKSTGGSIRPISRNLGRLAISTPSSASLLLKDCRNSLSPNDRTNFEAASFGGLFF